MGWVTITNPETGVTTFLGDPPSSAHLRQIPKDATKAEAAMIEKANINRIKVAVGMSEPIEKINTGNGE